MKRVRALALATLLCAGCQASTGSPTPSAPPSASEAQPSPSSVASTASGFPSIELPPESRATLVTALTAFTSPGEEPSREVAAGTEVIVTGGPRERHGETWYEIVYPLAADELLLPWVRIDDPASVRPVTATCPASQSETLGLLAWDRMSCIGDATVTVEGQVGHCQGGVVQVDPGWLGYACWTVCDDDTFSMDIHADPTSGITLPDDLVRARMTGHFDDPAATTCVYAGDPDAVSTTPSASEQVLLCREAFVVDTFEILEVIGTPPAA